MTRFTLWSKSVALSLPFEQAFKNQRWKRFSVKDDDGASSLLEMHSPEILKFFSSFQLLMSSEHHNTEDSFQTLGVVGNIVQYRQSLYSLHMIFCRSLYY